VADGSGELHDRKSSRFRALQQCRVAVDYALAFGATRQFEGCISYDGTRRGASLSIGEI
jgi:hypothetical protein